MLGRTVVEQDIPDGIRELSIPVFTVSSGMYSVAVGHRVHNVMIVK